MRKQFVKMSSAYISLFILIAFAASYLLGKRAVETGMEAGNSLVCGNKTRLKLREDTILKNFPLYCPKCKQEALINVQQMNMSIIKEPTVSPACISS